MLQYGLIVMTLRDVGDACGQLGRKDQIEIGDGDADDVAFAGTQLSCRQIRSVAELRRGRPHACRGFRFDNRLAAHRVGGRHAGDPGKAGHIIQSSHGQIIPFSP